MDISRQFINNPTRVWLAILLLGVGGLFARTEPFGDHHSLRGHFPDRDSALLKIQMGVFAFYHPDDRFILRSVIGVKHCFHGHYEGFPSGAGRQIAEIDRHGAANPADGGKIIWSRHG